LKVLFEKQGNDLVTLGVGPDGHIASLFPPVTKEALDSNRIVLHTTTSQFAVFDRITVTIPILKKSKAHAFFLKGKDKVEMWKKMISEWFNPERWPAHEVLATKNSTVICTQ
jgi:6-phosphogluconolactonase/glucosamine-6-phosphate isomerase/deaminase